jgi:MFS family permease
MIFQGRARFIVLAALCLLHFMLMATTFNSLGQVLPFMVADLGMNWGEAGFGFTLLGIACGAASLGPALLSRRAGHSVTLLVGTLFLAGGFAALATTDSVPMYHLGTTLLGLGYCFCGTVPSVHVITNIFDRRSTALGVYFTSGSLGAVIGPIMFLAVHELIGGWRIYWVMCAVVALGLGAFAVLVTRGARQTAAPATEAIADNGDAWTVRGALATSQFWVIVAAYTGCLVVNTTVHGFAFQHLMEHGQSKASATALISGAALVGVFASAAAGLIGEKVDARRLALLSLAALTLTSASLIMAEGWFFLTLFVVSMGVGLGFSYVSTAMLMQDYFGRRASLELYSIMAALSTTAAFGPGLGGMVRDSTGNFSAVFAGLALIDVVLLVAVLAMRRPRPAGASSALVTA